MNNEMILASAGSGKTWQLTNRYIALMGRDLLAGREPKPEAILAATFTRKAAGEFFDEILKKLAQGATSEDDARKLAGQPDEQQNPLYPTLKQLRQSHYQQLLLLFIERMPRLFLGTLDSLFANIVRSFPAEFGLAGSFEVLSEHQGKIARQETLRKVFDSANNTEERNQFLESFRLATLGSNEASVQRLLDKFIEEHHHLLLAAAGSTYWGNSDRIWPEGNPWLKPERTSLTDLCSELYSHFKETDFSPNQRKFWDEFQTQLPTTTAGNLPKRVGFFVEKFLANWDAIQGGEVTLSVSKKQTFGAEECAIISRLTTKIVGAELDHHLQRTQGIWEILAQYEIAYSQQVRRKGRLTFHDLEVLLAGAPGSPRPLLAQGPGEDTRLRIDYRLDARFEHWLLDEFQDTSFLQWSIVENLIDEAVQDLSGDRSLFLVGDIKQAIYAWRGGDTRLFHDVANRYQGEDNRALKLRDLSVSWRSGEDVIQPLNQIFGNKAVLTDLGLPEEAVEQWHWTPHQVADPNRQHPGLTAYYHPDPAEGEKKATSEDCYALTLAILEEIQPIKNGLSCVILVQGNKEARAIVDYVRAHSVSKLSIASESDVAVALDNPVTLAFLNLFHLAAHPGDLFAQGYLDLNPLQTVMKKSGFTQSQLGEKIRLQVHSQGFESTLRHWVQLAEDEDLLDDLFSQQRLEELALAARLFDESGDLSLDRFLSYAKSYTLREPNSKSAIQVMTIHKSKGLTYDMAILPQLTGNALTTARSGMGVQRDRETREVDWIFDLPPKGIAGGDENLQKHRTHLESEAGYEQLCKFYVALTRARYANYLIAPARPPKSKSGNFIKLLDDTLVPEDADELEDATLNGVNYQIAYESDLPTSHARWWEQLKSKPKKPSPTRKAPPTPSLKPRLRPSRSTPSRSFTSTTPRTPFSTQENQTLEFGSLVHQLFEQLAWWDEKVEIPNQSTYPKEALTHLERVLASRDCQALLAKPFLTDGQSADLWREQSFEILLDEHWTSGIIDRIQIVRDSEGKALSAQVIDFKTDKVASESEAVAEAKNYQTQMATYRQATATLLSLPLENITTHLLFTSHPFIVSL